MSKCRRAGYVLLCLVAAGISTLAQDRIPGDVNSDGAVDFADFLILASNYGKSGPLPVSDGVVDTVIVTRANTLYEEDLRPEPLSAAVMCWQLFQGEALRQKDIERAS
jgi:hypothetical protein